MTSQWQWSLWKTEVNVCCCKLYELYINRPDIWSLGKNNVRAQRPTPTCSYRPYRKYSVRAQQTWNEVHAGLANYQIWVLARPACTSFDSLRLRNSICEKVYEKSAMAFECVESTRVANTFFEWSWLYALTLSSTLYVPASLPPDGLSEDITHIAHGGRTGYACDASVGTLLGITMSRFHNKPTSRHTIQFSF